MSVGDHIGNHESDTLTDPAHRDDYARAPRVTDLARPPNRSEAPIRASRPMRIAIELIAALAVSIAAAAWAAPTVHGMAAVFSILPTILAALRLGAWSGAAAATLSLALFYTLIDTPASTVGAVLVIGSLAGLGALIGARNDLAIRLQIEVARRRRTEHDLKQSEARFRHLSDGSHEGLLLHDDGRIIDVNPALCRLTGYSRNQLVGIGILDLVRPDFHATVLNAIAEGLLDPYELVALDVNAEELWLEVIGRPMPYNDRDVRVTAVRDIRWRKEAEDHLRRANDMLERRVAERTARLSAANARLQEEIGRREQAERDRGAAEERMQHAQKLQSIGALAGGIAHDFNNLLTGALGNAELSRLKLSSDSPALPHIDRIERTLRHGADVVAQLLTYASSAAQPPRPLRLDVLVEEMHQLVRISIPGQASMTVELEPVTISGDPTRLRQLVLNLITNAADALQERTGKICMRLYECGPEELPGSGWVGTLPNTGPIAVLELEDDGVGMDATTQAHLFDAFYSTKATGRGLGMAAALGIARAHGGAIMVQSAIGEGSIVTVALPAGGQAESTHPTVPQSPEIATGERILIVDDEDELRSATAELLRLVGYSTEVASDGLEAVARFRARPDSFDIVLMDVIMPGLDGPGALARIREIRPDTRVVLMTGYASQDAQQRAMKHNPVALIRKPFRADELRRVLRAALDEPL